MECQFEYTVSDADFGFWDPAWGDPEVHVFTCGEPAVGAIVLVCEHGADEIPLCAPHFLLAVL